VPLGLAVFVTALAIADDLLAVLVIAAFYSAELNVAAILVAAGVLGTLLAANRLGIQRAIVYGALGIALWAALHESGVHATVAGVLLALAIPSQPPADTSDRPSVMHRMEHVLEPWVSFGIVPLFALANAGVALPAEVARAASDPIVVGVVLGLLLGKQVGITLAAWLVVRAGLAELPSGVGWRHVYGAAWLGGIGFTMALFIAELAFGQGARLDAAKLGILAASVIAGVGGFVVLRSSER
jgi:NhaA family Na+:H+ antiporter